MGKYTADNCEYNRAYYQQKNTVLRCAVCPVKVLLTQTAGQQGIDTDAGTGRHGNHQVLYRESQRYRRQRIFTDTGYEHAVHNVV